MVLRSALSRRPIEIPIGGLDQPPGGASVRALEAVKCGQRAAWGDLEDRAIVGGPAKTRCPIKIPIDGLDQTRGGAASVRAMGLRTKAVKDSQEAARGDLEDCAYPLRSA